MFPIGMSPFRCARAWERVLGLAFATALAAPSARASSVLASSFGYDPANATAAFQAAVLSPYDTVVIDLQAADWNVGPSTFFGLTGKTIVFQPGVKLRALPGAFPAINDCLFRLAHAQQVAVIGYGAEFVMDKAEFAALNDSEFRHSISLYNCASITIRGLTLTQSGGDGIYIGGQQAPSWPSGACQDIVVEDVWMRDHYRQGMSVTSVQGLTVRHCWFTGTLGTLPESGVDIEPYLPYQPVQDVLFEHCYFANNGHCGIQVSLWELDASSPPVEITFRDCRTQDNGRPGHPYGPNEIDVYGGTSLVQGLVRFERVHVDGSDWSAVDCAKHADAFTAQFQDCAFMDVSRSPVPYNAPIWIETPSYTGQQPLFGGLHFSDCVVTSPAAMPHLWAFGFSGSQGVGQVSFSGTVAMPNGGGTQLSNAADTVDCTFAAALLPALPSAQVTWQLAQPIGQECGAVPVQAVAARAGSMAFPLPVRYELLGEAIPGDDVHLPTGSAVIATGLPQALLELVPRDDGLPEGSESITVVALPGEGCTLAGVQVLNGEVHDCLLTGAAAFMENPLYRIVPNPATDAFRVEGLHPQQPIEVRDATGRLLHRGPAGEVPCLGWMPGVYLVSAAGGAHHHPLKVEKH